MSDGNITCSMDHLNKMSEYAVYLRKQVAILAWCGHHCCHSYRERHNRGFSSPLSGVGRYPLLGFIQREEGEGGGFPSSPASSTLDSEG